MTRAADILMLAEPVLGRRLTEPLPAHTVTLRDEPFAALEALARRPYAVVMVHSPQPELGNLLRAVRRLQPDARIFGLCTPAGEIDLRIEGQVLEDYFIIPPTRREWRRILSAAAGPGGPSPAGPALTPGALRMNQIAELVDAAQDLDTLADRLTELVAGVLETEVRWSLAQSPRAGAQQLLTLDDDPPRVLWSSQVLQLDDAQSQWLSALRGLLPALSANARKLRILHRMAITDDLTGAYNRRYFMHFGQQLLRRARQSRFRVTMLVYDIDDFKIYNDRYGHAAGDAILRQTALMMQQITRKHDVVARIGGDEFAVLFWDAGPTRQPNSQPPQSAYALADRFRQAVNSHQFEMLGPDAVGQLTISGGLASFPWDGLSMAELLGQADEALMHAKACGKNRIQIVGQPDAEADQPQPE